MIEITGMPERAVNAVSTQALAFATPPDVFEMQEALLVLAAWVLRQGGMESDAYLPALRHIWPAISRYSVSLSMALDMAGHRFTEAKKGLPDTATVADVRKALGDEPVSAPGQFIEVLDGRYVGVAPPTTALFDAESGKRISRGVLPQLPVRSEAIFLPAVYLRTVAKYFGHGAAAELESAGLLGWQFHGEYTP